MQTAGNKIIFPQEFNPKIRKMTELVRDNTFSRMCFPRVVKYKKSMNFPGYMKLFG
jgi:hypothetical protein